MSAPSTNITKQENRHRVPLLGIRLCLGFAALLLMGWLILLATKADDNAPVSVTPAASTTDIGR